MTIVSKHVFRSLVVMLFLAGFAASAQLADRKVLTLEGAKQIAAAAKAEAVKNNWRVVVAVVDEGSHLIYFERMDNIQTASIDVAIKKAKSAAAFHRPLKSLEDALVGGRMAIIALPGAMPFDGGYPIMAGDEVVGAVGVSGMTTGPQDGQVARAGAAAAAKF